MGLGDFLTGIDDAIDTGITKLPFVGDDYAGYIERTRQEAEQQRLRGEHPSFFSTVGGDGNEVLSLVDKAIRAVPGGGFILDLPNRTFNTIGTAGLHAGAAGEGELLNKDTWARAWDSWNQAGHLTGGEAVALRMSNDPRVELLDPFDAQDAQALKNMAHSTWYGEIFGAAADLGAGFVSIPGTGVLKAARSTNKLDKLTDVERVAQREKEVFDFGGTPGLVAPTRLKDTANAYVGREVSADSLMDRLARSVAKTDGIETRGQMMNRLSPYMEGASDAGKSHMADLFVETNKLIDDPRLLSHVKINLLLAAQGSTAAKVALTDSAPLIARMLEKRSGPPLEAGLFEDMVDSYRTGGDVRINETLARYFDTPGRKAEREALEKELFKARQDAATARELLTEARAAKPKGDALDVTRLQEARARAQQNVADLTEQLKAARNDVKAARSLGKEVARSTTGAIRSVEKSNRAVGGSEHMIAERKLHLSYAQDQNALAGNIVQRSMADRRKIEADYLKTRAILDRMDLKDPSRFTDRQANIHAATQARMADLVAQLGEARDAVDAARSQAIRTRMVETIRRADANRNPGERSLLAIAEHVAEIDRKNLVGQIDQVHEVGKLHGEATTRVAELEARLKQARSDRDLLNSTPLRDPDLLTDYKAEVDAARGLRKDTLATKEWLNAERRALIERDKQITGRMATVRPSLAHLGRMMDEIWSLGDQEVFTGKVEMTMLDSMKTKYRDFVDDHYIHEIGDSSVIVRGLSRTMAAIGTPMSRGAINLAEIDRGSRELELSMKRSNVFSPAEIAAFGEELLRTPAGRRQVVVAKVEEEMLKRIAFEFHLTKEAALERTQVALSSYRQGREWLSKGVVDAGADADIVRIVDPEDLDQGHYFNGPALRSHLADTVGFIDPAVFRRALRRHLKAPEDLLRRSMVNGVQTMDFANSMWRHATLIRPGLGVRAMLDTGLRATALLGAATQMVNAVNGAVRVHRKLDAATEKRLAESIGTSRALAGPHAPAALRSFARGQLDKANKIDVAGQMMGMSPALAYDLGDGLRYEFQAYKDAAELASLRLAMTKGSSVHDSLLQSSNRLYAGLKRDNSRWEYYKADAEFWPIAYESQVNLVLASPTARRLLDDMVGPDRNLSVEAYTKELFDRPGVQQEYLEMGKRHDLTREEWVASLIRELYILFPERKAIDLAREGRLTEREIAKIFPKTKRFDVPGPHSMLTRDDAPNLFRRTLDSFYRAVLDNPDFWMARHPVYVNLYQRQVRDEIQAMLKTVPDGETIPMSVLNKINGRARAKAISTVRRTFFDTTRNTPATVAMSRIAPFFNAWEDAMLSWGRLIYDDPKRLSRIGGAWNLPTNANAWLPKPLLVDAEGRAVAQGQEPEGGTYIVAPFKIGGVQMNWRKEAFNSIAQGNVWYLPGVGPLGTSAATLLTGKGISNESALKLAGTDWWGVKQIRESMYLDGELPPEDLTSIATSVLPAGWRNAFRDSFGVTGAQTKAFAMNQLYLESQAAGRPFDPVAAEKQAQKLAWTAATVRFVSQSGMGLSGRATIDAQFYIDQMHILDATPIEELRAQGYNSSQEAFADKFPEAAELDWRFSENETGINATVNAQSEASRHRKLLDQEPDLGWFIVGAENVAQGRPGDEFSRSAYNQQTSDGYGITDAKRKRPTGGEAVVEALQAMGWSEWTKFTLGLEEYARNNGLPEEFTSFAKAAFRDDLGARNSEWLKDYTTRKDRAVAFYARAEAIAKRPEMANRTDMQMFLQYREARAGLMAELGIKSLSGTSQPYAIARGYLRQLGQNMASQNIGFDQLWNRMLSAEVDALETDQRAIEEAASGAPRSR